MARSADDRRAARSRGQRAEARVAEVLEGRGWQVLDRNWSTRAGELDLVVERAGAVRFVEVRARQSGDDSALASITRAKQRRLIRAAEAWLLTREAPREVAFVVAVVELGPEPWPVELYDDAFDAG